MITRKNIIVHELIGLSVRVKNALSQTYVDIQGKVVDETLNTIVIRTTNGDKRIPKKGTVFEFVLPTGEKVDVKGNDILNKPENRIKRSIHKL